MSNLGLLDRLEEASNQPEEGWDFSLLDKWGGKPEFPCPWNYHELVSAHLKEAGSLLDMGTGGGEFLSSFKKLPPRTVATESYIPNVPVAQKTLTPLNIEVVHVKKGAQENAALPFDRNSFDLVICRHDFYDSKEVFRILRAGGLFITQQVGSNDLTNLKLIFGKIDQHEWSGSVAEKQLAASGFQSIENKQQMAPTRFYDIRTVVYYLNKLKWNFPNFSLTNDYQRMHNIDSLIQRDGFFEDTCHRFLMIAKK